MRTLFLLFALAAGAGCTAANFDSVRPVGKGLYQASATSPRGRLAAERLTLEAADDFAADRGMVAISLECGTVRDGEKAVHTVTFRLASADDEELTPQVLGGETKTARGKEAPVSRAQREAELVKSLGWEESPSQELGGRSPRLPAHAVAGTLLPSRHDW